MVRPGSVVAAVCAGAGVALYVLYRRRRPKSGTKKRSLEEDADGSRKRTRSSDDAGGGIVVLGDAFVDVLVCGLAELPRWNADVLAPTPITMQAGGSALNTAVHLAGVADGVALHTALADDEFGAFLARSARSRGVALFAAAGLPGGTGACVVLSGEDRGFATHRGVVDVATAADLGAETAVARARDGGHVHLAGYYNCTALRGGAAALFRSARAAGAATSLGAQHDATGAWDGIGTAELAGDDGPDYLILSEDEARAVVAARRAPSAGGAEADARALLDLDAARCCVVTLGPLGALAVVPRADGAIVVVRSPCADVAVADPTGAGDAFVAGFVAGLEQRSLRYALCLGCACGAACVANVGASAPLDGGRRDAALAACLSRAPPDDAFLS